MLIQKEHKLVPLFYMIEEKNKSKLIQKSLFLMKLYSEMLIKAENFTKRLIDSIINNSKYLIQEIEVAHAISKRVHSCICRSTPIYWEDLNFVEKLRFSSEHKVEFDHKLILNIIDSSFECEKEKIYEQETTRLNQLYGNIKMKNCASDPQEKFLIEKGRYIDEGTKLKKMKLNQNFNQRVAQGPKFQNTYPKYSYN